jgi:hypothetical protein
MRRRRWRESLPSRRNLNLGLGIPTAISWRLRYEFAEQSPSRSTFRCSYEYCPTLRHLKGLFMMFGLGKVSSRVFFWRQADRLHTSE